MLPRLNLIQVLVGHAIVIGVLWTWSGKVAALYIGAALIVDGIADLYWRPQP